MTDSIEIRIGQIWRGARVLRYPGFLVIALNGDLITYDKLFLLSSVCGSSEIDICHESGGAYSDVTPDLRPGRFEIVVRNPRFEE